MFKKGIKIKELARMIKNTRFSELVKEFDDNQMKVIYHHESDIDNLEAEHYTISQLDIDQYSVCHRYMKIKDGEVIKYTSKRIVFDDEDDKAVIRELILKNNFSYISVMGNECYYRNLKHKKEKNFKLKYTI